MKKALSMAAALALLLLALVVIVQGSLLPLLAGDADSDSTREALRHYRSIAADHDRLRQAIAALPAPPEIDAGRLPQTSDALALAELQSRLSALAAPLGVAVTAAEPLPNEQDDGSGKVQLRLELGGSLAALQALVHGIEGGRPVMEVTALDLQARPDQQGLSARLTVAAWRTPS